ncbi:TetR family transcriptional regulator [Kitasatospora sp. MMS16-BH015]|uniref:TetR/AcrR family transcriptional regulator n=1 Tax=Kitasatospora sp. MMS16-BH015 TaxID=2018025 RepID=UPI000CA34A81|nr:TetR/AcrR family transcriptional regulator [Kitasatospora sp. MMS16-BH015]AUG82143.1 TetR family transcriptional regulator [Kitasatospora sp. MMS16-BH015]
MHARRYHHGDLRAALLERAEQTLREKGPAALSLRELARDLGVSHAAPSRHFKDKQALLDALALAGFERLNQALAEGPGPHGPFAERLAALARAYVGFATANPELLDLMYTVKHDPEATEALVAAAHQGLTQAAALFADAQRTGEVRPGPVEQICLPALATVHGFADLAVGGLLSPEQARAGLEEVIAYVLRGCAPDRP